MDNSDFRAAQDGKSPAAKRESFATSKNAAGRLRRDSVSLEALINVLVQQGLCTEEQLLAEEARLRAVQSTMANLQHFKPVRVPPALAGGKQKKHPLRTWASQRRWTRQLGTILFGWRWHKYKKKERSGSAEKNLSRTK